MGQEAWKPVNFVKFGLPILNTSVKGLGSGVERIQNR